MNIFGKHLKLLRESGSLTQNQMAVILGITERGYRAYENGTSTPHFEKLLYLADYFNVSLDYLTGRTENPKISK